MTARTLIVGDVHGCLEDLEDLLGESGWDEDDHFAFQGWYRDPSGPCDTGFNLTNALDVVFEP